MNKERLIRELTEIFHGCPGMTMKTFFKNNKDCELRPSSERDSAFTVLVSCF